MQKSTGSGASRSSVRSVFFRWRWLIFWGLFALLGIWIALLAWKWPFTRKAVIAGLEHESGRTVQIGAFHGKVFPPGYVAEELRLAPSSKNGKEAVTARKLAIRASWSDLLLMRRRIQLASIVGLRMRIPARSESATGSHDTKPRFSEIGELKLEDAAFAFPSSDADSDPFTITLQSVSFDKVNRTSPSPFRARIFVNVPKGTIRSEGQIGPWNWNDPGRTPLAGSFVMEQADLSVLGGVAGILTANGGFRGPLRHIACSGTLDVPQFRVEGHDHSAHLWTTFRTVVDGLNGDIVLNDVESRLANTRIECQGTVQTDSQRPGKAARLHLSASNGRIEDFLSLFTRSVVPSMTGAVSMQADVNLPPGPPGFLQKVDLAGEFNISDGRFTNSQTQREINHLSKSAEGMSKSEEKNNSGIVFSCLKGHVVAENGTATLSRSTFDATGAHADISGTYNLLDTRLNLHGVLRTTGKLSDTTSGVKAALLKVVTPFWKKKSMTVVPFTIAGRAQHPEFSLNLTR